MAEVVTMFKSNDGGLYASESDADARNFSLEVCAIFDKWTGRDPDISNDPVKFVLQNSGELKALMDEYLI